MLQKLSSFFPSLAPLPPTLLPTLRRMWTVLPTRFVFISHPSFLMYSHWLCHRISILSALTFPLSLSYNTKQVFFFYLFISIYFFLFVCLRQTLGEFEAVAIFIDISYISEFKVSYYHLDILDTCALSLTEQNIEK